MIDPFNLGAGALLLVAASLPAIGLAQSPRDAIQPGAALQSAPVAGALPLPGAPPPPQMSELVPRGISAEVWTHALAAHEEAIRAGKTSSPLLTVIDYSRPANEKRLWVVDVRTIAVVDKDYVAHGEGSGNALAATRFSNRDGSHQSSLGTFITGEVFFGVRGRSLELHGLEEGINDNAYARGILIHGTRNVSEARALQGTQGVTEGCAGVPAKSAKRLIGRIARGTVVFIWYPERRFLEQSEYLDRASATERLSEAD